MSTVSGFRHPVRAWEDGHEYRSAIPNCWRRNSCVCGESGAAKRAVNKDLVIPEFTADGQKVTAIGDASAGGTGLFATETEKFDSVFIPNGVKTIGNYAFQNNGLDAVTFPSQLESIGMVAFQTNDLTSVILPDTVTSLGSGAFATNPKLERISLSKGLTEIPASAFGCSDADNYMTNLTSIELHEGITSIGSRAFAGNNFSNIVIPSTVKEIGSYAFFSCTDLEQIWIDENVTSIASTSFDNCNLLTIHGVAGSYAEEYAVNNNIPFSTDPVSTIKETITGTIVDSEGNGIVDVSIYVYDLTDEQLIGYYHTDANGKWKTSKCTSGNEYLISYYHKDYEISTNKFLVNAITGTLALDTVTATKIVGDYEETDPSYFEYEIINGSNIRITNYIGAPGGTYKTNNTWWSGGSYMVAYAAENSTIKEIEESYGYWPEGGFPWFTAVVMDLQEDGTYVVTEIFPGDGTNDKGDIVLVTGRVVVSYSRRTCK